MFVIPNYVLPLNTFFHLRKLKLFLIIGWDSFLKWVENLATHLCDLSVHKIMSFGAKQIPNQPKWNPTVYNFRVPHALALVESKVPSMSFYPDLIQI